MPSTNTEDVDSTHFLSSVSIHKIECLCNWFHRITKAYFYQDCYSEARISKRDGEHPENQGMGQWGGTHVRTHCSPLAPLQGPGPTLVVSQAGLLRYISYAHCVGECGGQELGSLSGGPVSKDAISFTVTVPGPDTVPGTWSVLNEWLLKDLTETPKQNTPEWVWQHLPWNPEGNTVGRDQGKSSQKGAGGMWRLWSSVTHDHFRNIPEGWCLLQ